MNGIEKFNKDESIEKQEKEIRDEIELLAEDFNAENIPVDDNCRLNIKGYESRYTSDEIEKDYRYIKEKEREFANTEGLTVEKWKESKKFRNGEKFEQLKTVVFNRNFSNPDIIAVRASDYDDYKNSIDNVIINKKTGDIICALDEVADDKNGKRYIEKERKIKEINEKGGAELKYGLTFEDGKPVLKEIKGVSIFILSLSSLELREAVKNFGSGKFENKLFKEKFGKQAIEQLRKLPSYVSQDLKEQWMNCF